MNNPYVIVGAGATFIFAIVGSVIAGIFLKPLSEVNAAEFANDAMFYLLIGALIVVPGIMRRGYKRTKREEAMAKARVVAEMMRREEVKNNA